MKLILLNTLAFLLMSSFSHAELMFPPTRLALTDVAGNPLSGLYVSFDFTYELWGTSCRKGLGICPGYKITGADREFFPAVATNDLGVVNIPEFNLRYSGLTKRNPLLKIFLKDYSVNHRFFSFVSCTPQIPIEEGKSYMIFDSHFLEQMTKNRELNSITCIVDITK